MGDLRDTLDINHIRVWIAQSLDMYCPGILLDRILDLFIVKWIYEGCRNAISRECVGKQVVSTTLNVLCRYDVITGMSQVFKGVSNRCCTGSHCQCCHSTL